MSRLRKILGVVGLSSVYLMQAPCFTSPNGGGVNILPNISIGNLNDWLGM